MKMIPLILLGFSFAAASVSQASAQGLAFPGAEGAGRFSAGGRGGRVLHVYNMEDSGPGTLRNALEASGPRTIVFDFDGTIELERPLIIRNGRVTIAGQTAPGGGITIRNHPLVISADDVVVRYIRSRLGDEAGVQGDAITIARGRRIILDHVSASWSVDETLSVGLRSPKETSVGDVTVQWSIISESLNKSKHDKGDHGYGSLIRASYGQKISFHHNLWAHHKARMPRPGNYETRAVDPDGALIEFRSNVFYNWGSDHAGYNADKDNAIGYNFIDNAYVMGPQSTKPVALEEDNMAARAHFAGNSMNGTVPADPWSLVVGPGAARAGYRLAAPLDVGAVAADPAPSAFERVLAGAGASFARDSVDARVVETVRTRTGKLIDTEAEVGGWPLLVYAKFPADTDEDGMPDNWETAHGLDIRNPADGAADKDGDGYTNLEDYLNHLAAQPVRVVVRK